MRGGAHRSSRQLSRFAPHVRLAPCDAGSAARGDRCPVGPFRYSDGREALWALVTQLCCGHGTHRVRSAGYCRTVEHHPDDIRQGSAIGVHWLISTPTNFAEREPSNSEVGSGEDWDIIEAALGSGISIRSGAKRFVADLKSRSVLICQAIHATARTPRWLLVTDEVAVRCGRRGQRRLAVGTRFSMTRLP